ncbi:Galactose oxidase/kelch repeat superfamily protein [Arabidopsis thaliana]|jgi:hypothetical protein|uniref:Galactose oxidase/kelch repeat superfamily protein n=2 Tax=Arabidopsis thaliana TaxID=3702 RepID=F4I8K4_ARATH|nr:Galactose oxidase/kelch repeat superfamily protein [Arabidopsis thaliana]AEE36039.1 Galactose oxidase/kelch repeat superfamily protein [Arabidopsis thaliana]OAP16741.1 hypothetical protein AXX17_AT1G72470 [Arabidopsis thaliana]|eukprot:NP_001154474.1 Galactose oxidase/kelch repeat superfamily protein [Arabidopsis thaliana]
MRKKKKKIVLSSTSEAEKLFLEANIVMMKYRAINNLIEEMLKLV